MGRGRERVAGGERIGPAARRIVCEVVARSSREGLERLEMSPRRAAPALGQLAYIAENPPRG